MSMVSWSLLWLPLWVLVKEGQVRDSMKRSFKGCMDLLLNIFCLSLIKCKKYNYLLFSFYLIALTQRWMEIEQDNYVYHGWP